MVRGFRAVSGLGLLATAASLGLHAALLATLGWREAPTSDAPSRPPIILSLAAPNLARAVTPEPPASADFTPADESAAAPAPAAAAMPPSPIPPVETAGDAPREAQAIAEAAPDPGPSAPVEAPAADATVAAEPAPPAEMGNAAPRDAPAVPEVTRPVHIAEAAPAGKAVPDPGSPPSVEAPAADATRDAPAVPEVTRPVHIAEAAPPAKAVPDPGPSASVEAPAADATVAAEPAPPAETGNVAPRAAPAVTRPVQIAQVAPPVKAVPDPGSLVLVEASEVATPDAVLPVSPQSVPPIPPDVGSAPDVSPPAAQTLAPDAPSAAAAVVPPPEARVASLDAPTVSAERIRGFVDRYDGGPCFFASVARTTPTGVDIDSFSSSVEQVMAFHAAFMGQLSVEPDVMGQRVWNAQCPAVEFLRRTRSNSSNPVTINLDHRTLSRGDLLSGAIRGAVGRQVSLYLVSEMGMVEDISTALKRRVDAESFAVPVRHEGSGGPFPEMVIAIVGMKPTLALGNTGASAHIESLKQFLDSVPPITSAVIVSASQLFLVR